MGIIQRQSLKNTIVNFLGVAIGIISILYIYSLDHEIYGYAQFIVGMAFIFIPFASFGSPSLVVKFYPEFKDDVRKDNGFLPLILMVSVLGILFFLLIMYLFKSTFYNYLDLLEFDVDLIRDNELLIFCMGVMFLLIQIFTRNAANFGSIVVPALFQNFAFKIFLPIWVILWVLKKLTFAEFGWGLFGFYTTSFIALFIYSWVTDKLTFGFDFSRISLKLAKRMWVFMTFGMINSIGNMLAFRIDSIMISTLLGTASNGLYTNILFIANTIDIPTNAISQITSPIVSSSFKEGRLDEINTIYQKSSLNLMAAGSFIFLLIWFLIDHLFAISSNPESFSNGRMIFLFLGLGKLFNMATSINNNIIIYSNFYKYNLLFLFVLAITNIVANYVLIDAYDVIGAAMASCLALFIFNVMKYVFILVNLKMQPLTMGVLKILAISILVFATASVIPDWGNNYLMIIIKGGVISMVYVSCIYLSKVSLEINDLIDNSLQSIFRK